MASKRFNRRDLIEAYIDVQRNAKAAAETRDLAMRRYYALSSAFGVLLEKPGKRAVTIDADFVGFVCPDVFVVGYGMDAAHAFRQLPFVGVVDYGDGGPDLFDA